MTRLYSRAGSASLIIEETGEGIFLYSRRNQDGFEGDTWHQSIADAKAQAIYQFGPSSWTPVPDDVSALRAFLKRISN
jgi:hypothetical protein